MIGGYFGNNIEGSFPFKVGDIIYDDTFREGNKFKITAIGSQHFLAIDLSGFCDECSIYKGYRNWKRCDVDIKELIKMSRTKLNPLPWTVLIDPARPDKVGIMDAKEYYVIPPMDTSAYESVFEFIVNCVNYANKE